MDWQRCSWTLKYLKSKQNVRWEAQRADRQKSYCIYLRCACVYQRFVACKCWCKSHISSFSIFHWTLNIIIFLPFTVEVFDKQLPWKLNDVFWLVVGYTRHAHFTVSWSGWRAPGPLGSLVWRKGNTRTCPPLPTGKLQEVELGGKKNTLTKICSFS